MTSNDRARTNDLERLFGDPTYPDRPFSYRAIIEADADRRLVDWAEQALQEWGFAAEFVPESLGGKWRSTEDLVRRLLPVFRRDIGLGLGQGVTTLMAAVNVWVAGDSRTKNQTARHLLAGGRIAVGFHELSHGNDLLQNECTAARDDQTPGGGWRISGRKEVINNVDRASQVLLFARTQGGPDPRSFSILMWEKRQTISGQFDTSGRILTSGVRGCQIGRATFQNMVIPGTALVGEAGTGVATALRAFQITRAVIPALATGAVDAAIRLAVKYMGQRNLYDETVWDLPHARYLLARSWSSLVLADIMARTAVRALHVKPDESFFLSSATKHLVPLLLNDAMQDLTTVFGSTFYAITEEYGVVEKWVRDLVTLPIGHAGSLSCLLSLIPNLPTWARRLGRTTPHVPALFSTDAELNELSFADLGIGVGRLDSVTAPLRSPEVLAALRFEQPEAEALVLSWGSDLEQLRDEVSALSPRVLGPDAPPHVFHLARRVSATLAAGAVLGTWFESRSNPSSPFAAGDFVLVAVFTRLNELLVQPSTREESEPTKFGWPQKLSDAVASHVAQAVTAGLSLGAEELELGYTKANTKIGEDK